MEEYRRRQSEQRESLHARMIQAATLVAHSARELRRPTTHLENAPAGHELSLEAVDLATPSSGKGQASTLSEASQSITTVVLERVPITWNHVIDKDSLKFKELEHVLIEKVEQLFRDML